MEKVKVTKEVAEAIERIKGSLMPVGTLIDTVNGDWKLRGRNAIVVQQLTKEEALSAIFYGYDVEKTPEEIVNDRIKEIKSTPVVFREDVRLLDAEMNGIKLVVDAFGLKGVNA